MTAMAFGNFSQHIFVDPDSPLSNYTLTYNCIDCPGNQTTFNDGYHIIHHLNGRMHWAEMPSYFHANLEKIEVQDSITFRGIHFFDVGILVMTKQLRKLVEKYSVHVGSPETAPTIEQVEERLRAWLVPVPAEARAAAAASVKHGLSKKII